MIAVVLALRPSGAEGEIAKIRAEGYPVRVEDINAWYPAVAAESNAALGVLATAELRIEGDSPSLQMPRRGEEVGPELLAKVRKYVADNSNTIGRLREALQLPESRYPVVVTGATIANSLPNPKLGELKALARLLNFETMHLVSEGKAEAAFGPVRDGLALAATLRNEPFVISELVRISFVAIALKSLECALPEGKFSEAELFEIAAWLARTEADSARSWHRAIIGDRTIGLQHFTTVAQTIANPTSAWDDLRGSLYRGLGFYDRDFRLYLEMMVKFSTAMTNSFPKAYQESVVLDQELNKRFSSGLGRFAVLSKGILPAMIKTTGKEAAIVTSLRCAQTAVAIERYRRANGGAVPDNLQQLVPEYLAEIPRDGAEGEPVVFERVAGGYQISSPSAAKTLNNRSDTVFPVVRWKFRGK